MNWRPTMWLVAATVIALDQATKQWALANLAGGQDRDLPGGFFSLRLVFNSGAAFSLGDGYTWLLTIVAVLVTGALVYYSRRAANRGMTVLFGVGLGGAVGNLIDRLFRDPSFGQGHVVDMINYGGYFVGNVADIAIVGSAALAVLLGLLGKPLLAPEPAAVATDASRE